MYGPRFFAQPTCHHVPDVYPGIGEVRSSRMLREFFRGQALAARATAPIRANRHYRKQRRISRSLRHSSSPSSLAGADSAGMR